MPDAANGPGRRPLVIGYGNSLRRDDGVGCRVSQLVAADPAAAGADVIAAHQLTPELAYDLHRASRVVLVDAMVGARVAPGRCVVTRLPAADPVAQAAGWGSTHHCTPELLAALARELYGSVAPVTVVGVAVDSFEPGETLTAAVASQLPRLTALVVALATGADPHPYRHRSPAMHEISLVAELVDHCVRLAERRGARHPVTTVRIRYATTIPVDVLRQAFETLTLDTPLAGTALDAEPFDVRLDCPACAFTGALGHDDVVGSLAVCPRCAEITAVRHPAELELIELVHGPQPAAQGPADHADAGC